MPIKGLDSDERILITTQEYVNILMGIVAFFGSYLFKNAMDRIKELETADAQNKLLMQQLELQLAGNYAKRADVEKLNTDWFKRLSKLDELDKLIASSYVSKEDFTKSFEAVLKKLDKIEDKLDHKADKD